MRIITALSSADWSTIATFSAVVVALFVGFLPRLTERVRRPKLSILVGSVEPYVEARINDPNSPGLVGSVHVRVGVKNLGKTTALRVVGRASTWCLCRLDIPTGSVSTTAQVWNDLQIVPAVLHWTRLPLGPQRTGPPEVDIPPETEELLDVAFHPRNAPYRLATDDDRVPGLPRPAHEVLAEHAIELVVVGANAAPVRATVGFRTDHTRVAPEVHVTSLPKDPKKIGLHTLLRQLGGSEQAAKQELSIDRSPAATADPETEEPPRQG